MACWALAVVLQKVGQITLVTASRGVGIFTSPRPFRLIENAV